MGMFLVVPDGDVLTGAVVVDGGTTLRMASLGNTTAGGTSRSRGVQPGEDRTSRRMTFPPTGDKDPNTHQAHAGYIGSTDNKSLQCAQWV